MGVDHGGADILVPKEFLHRPDVVPVLKQMSGVAVTKRVDAFALVDLGLLFGQIVDPLGVVNRKRTVLSVGKKPRWGTMLFPIRAQF